MRNLRIAALHQPRLHLEATPKDAATTRIAATAIDPEDDAIHVCTVAASQITDARIDVDVWRLGTRQIHVASFSTPASQCHEDEPQASQSAGPSRWTTSSKQSALNTTREIRSLVVLTDGGSFVQNEPAICIVCAGGDIALVSTAAGSGSVAGRSQSSFENNVNGANDEGEPALPEIVGSVEQGILAASWSPDQELLVLVTAPTPAHLAEDGVSKGSALLLMTREFEVLSENILQTDDFGEERPIALGWGSKATQFHGSEGKKAAAAAAASASDLGGNGDKIQRSSLNDDDDLQSRISWRGDSNVFVVSSVEGLPGERYRVVRTYSKSGSLLATSDPTAQGMSHTLAFKPTGILWATTQRVQGEHRLSFFERNGLYKDHFKLQDTNDTIREVSWNSDGSLLAVCTASDVQVWAMGNYHWYLKQQIHSKGPISSVTWHPEKACNLLVSTSANVSAYHFIWQGCVSPGRTPNDAACAAVVDGSKILLTPLRIQNVPPPMSTLVLTLPNTGVPIDLAWSDASTVQGGAVSILYILLHGGFVQAWGFRWGSLSPKAQRESVQQWKQPLLLCVFDFGLPARQVTAASVRRGDFVKMAVGILASEGFESLKTATRKVHLLNGTMGSVRYESLSLGRAATRTLATAPPTSDDKLLASIFVHEHKLLRNVQGLTLRTGEVLQHLQLVIKPDKGLIVIGLNGKGYLFADGRSIAQDATSFTATESHLIWLNIAHQAKFLNLADIESDNAIESLELSRRVERGSRIVAAVPSSMSLVLQMPRGNLETITPRPLLLEVVKRSLDEKKYRRAFHICRTHRLDMNIIADFGDQQLLQDMELFVKQLGESDHLNLFLSNLTPEHVNRKGRTIGIAELATPEIEEKKARVNSLCDRMREVLESYPDSDSYIHTIMTTHVRKSPPDQEAALRMLCDLKNRDPTLADDACKYIIFLTDADKLFKTALGLYDFTMPLLVAHHSPNRDPKEYLPYLRALREIQPLEIQRFRIDEELERWDSALSWLAKAGPEHFAAALSFAVKHELYRQALRIFGTDTDKLLQIQDRYGDWLMQKQRYKEAGVLYAQCKQTKKALDADVKAGQWQEALANAANVFGKDQSEARQVAQRISTSLISYGRFTEAATVAFDSLNDVAAGVRLLCKDLLFTEAKRKAAQYGRSDLIDACIRPMLVKAGQDLVRDIVGMRDQTEKQFARLSELLVRKRERPEDYYPEVGGDVDMNDGASLAFSTFTRYTRYSAFTANANRRAGAGGAPGSTMSQFTMATKKQENQAAKSSKREMRKQHTGKKGSIYEEDYIYDSLRKLLGQRLEKVQKDTANLLLHLVRLGDGDSQHFQVNGFDGPDDSGMLVAPMSGEDEDDQPQSKSVADLVKSLAIALDNLEKSALVAAEKAWSDVMADDAALEVERLRAIQEGLSLGLSWQQLQDNGLFAPPLPREMVKVSSCEWRLPALLPDL